MSSNGIVSIALTHLGNTTYYGSASSTRVMLETKFFDFDGYSLLQQAIGNLDKTLTGVRLEIGEGNLSHVDLYVGVKQRLKDDPTWYGPYNLEQGDDIIHTLDVEDARYFAFRIIDSSPSSVWQVSAMELFGLVGEGRV